MSADEPASIGACPRCGHPAMPLEPVQTRDPDGCPAEALWGPVCAPSLERARGAERRRRPGDFPGGHAWF